MAHLQVPAGGAAVTQIGVVVKDLRKTIKVYHETLGWGPWNGFVLKAPRLHHTMLRGEPVEYSMLTAETHVGPVDFELIEPLDGPSIYKEWLDKHGEGVHHIACMLPGSDYDANVANFERMGMKILMGGSIEDTIRFYYLESEPLLKIVLESGSGHAISLKPDWTYPE